MENPIKIKPYNSTGYVPGSGGVHPIGGYDYKSPEGTLWNVDAIEAKTVKLWTVNAWGSTHRQSVNRYEFERTWTRYSTDPQETKRLSWRTKADQFYKSAGCGQIHVIKFMGTCEGCGRSVYSHGCAGEKSCGDVVKDSPDSRGAIPAAHCMNLYHAREHGMAGRDVVTCYDCAQDGDKYRGIMAAAKSTGTWTPAEQNNCDGSGPHAMGTVKVLPTGGDGNMILCRSCWLREIRYRQERNRNLGDFAKFELPTWESGKVYETGGDDDGR